MYYIEISLFQLFSARLISTGPLGALSFSGLNFNIGQKESVGKTALINGK
jgi:hypothetical protein